MSKRKTETKDQRELCDRSLYKRFADKILRLIYHLRVFFLS